MHAAGAVSQPAIPAAAFGLRVPRVARQGGDAARRPPGSQSQKLRRTAICIWRCWSVAVVTWKLSFTLPM